MKAYPYMHKHPTSGQTEIATGKDLRDWFAGKALQGFVLDYVYDNSDDIAERAYTIADAMMKARLIKKDVPNE